MRQQQHCLRMQQRRQCSRRPHWREQLELVALQTTPRWLRWRCWIRLPPPQRQQPRLRWQKRRRTSPRVRPSPPWQCERVCCGAVLQESGHGRVEPS